MKRKLKETLFNILPPALLIVMTFGCFMPSSLFLGNLDEFKVGYGKVFPLILLVCVAMLAFLLLFGLILVKIKDYYIAFLFGCGLAIYVQGNFLNGSIPLLNGVEVDWSSFVKENIISGFFWTVLIVSSIVLMKIVKKKFSIVVKYGSYFLVAVQMVTLITLILTTKKTTSDDLVLSKQGEFEISNQGNIVVFVVDTLDAVWFDEYAQSHPDIKTELKDFTFFNDVVSGGAPTVLGIPAMLTGQYYDTNATIEKFYKDSYSQNPLFKEMKRSGYDVKIYTDISLIEGTDIEDVDNLLDNQSYCITDNKDFAKYLYKLAAIYASPQFFKQYFWFYTDEWSNLVSVDSKDIENYEFNDPQFYQDFSATGLKSSDQKTFVLYHLFGVHTPYNMNEDCELVEEGSIDKDAQLSGIFKILTEYMEQMKEMGCYDNSTIIITGDHGGLQLYQTPAVLVKMAGESRDADCFALDSRKATFKNLWATFATAAFGSSEGYGHNLFEVTNDENSVREHTATMQLGIMNYGDNEIIANSSFFRYLIKGDSKEFDNVEPVFDDLKNYLSVDLGYSVDFSTNATDSIASNMAHGLSTTTEAAGRWIVGNEVEFQVKLNDYKGGNLKVILSYSDLIDDHQIVNVYINGKQVDTINCNENSERVICEAVSESEISDNSFSIKYEVPNAVAPCDIEEGNPDLRKLSVRLNTLVVEME